MQQKKIHLIYCAANEAEVQTTITRLAKANYTFSEINNVKFDKKANFTEALFNINSPAILFLSDNFIKCTICMNGTTSLLKELIEKNQVLPVILDGRYANEDNTDYKLVATQIEKVGHILKYMNHWQDQYLSLRRKKRTEDLTEIEKTELQTVKSISSQVVDFLRCVKENTHLDYNTFKNNHFEAFFQRFGDKESYEQFRQVDQGTEVEATIKPRPATLPTEAIIGGDTIEPIASSQFNKLTPVEVLSYTNPVVIDSEESQELEVAASSTVKAFLGDDFIQQTADTKEAIGGNKAIAPLQETTIKEQIGGTENNQVANRVTSPLKDSAIAITANKQEVVQAIVAPQPKRPISQQQMKAAPAVPAMPIQEVITPAAQKVKIQASEQQRTAKESLRLPSLTRTAEEQVMMIMGATSPIGAAIAQFFADKGYRIILTGNRFSLLYKMKVSLEDSSQKGVQLLPFDPYNKYSVEMAMQDLDKDWKNINVLLNISDFGDTPLMDDKTCNYNQMLHTNIEVINNLTQKIVPYLKEQKNGHIINIVPIDVSTGKGQICKVLTEGVGAFTKTLQLDLSNYDIKVSQLLPEFKGNLTEEMGQGIASLVHYMTTQPDNLLIKNVTLSNEEGIKN